MSPAAAGSFERELADMQQAVGQYVGKAIDEAAIEGPLIVDGPRPGDRMRPLGMSGSRKLQDVLTDAKVAVSPGIGFGDYGDDHVRFALIENEQRTRQACRASKRPSSGRKDNWVYDLLRKCGGRDQTHRRNECNSQTGFHGFTSTVVF